MLSTYPRLIEAAVTTFSDVSANPCRSNKLISTDRRRQGLQAIYSDCLHATVQSASTVCDVEPSEASVFIGLPVLVFSLSRSSSCIVESKHTMFDTASSYPATPHKCSLQARQEGHHSLRFARLSLDPRPRHTSRSPVQHLPGKL